MLSLSFRGKIYDDAIKNTLYVTHLSTGKTNTPSLAFFSLQKKKQQQKQNKKYRLNVKNTL